MFAVGNFLGAIAQILDIALTVYMWIIILSALISWVNPDPNNPIVQFLRKASEPVLRPIRKMMGLRLTIDLSPIIAILIIIFLQSFVVRTLAQMAQRMQ
ncbi:MAG: YggT family protein [Thermodesulfovibrionales bacterium]|nr:YggT family protein [Thermodesulfovibrionales bacterium]